MSSGSLCWGIDGRLACPKPPSTTLLDWYWLVVWRVDGVADISIVIWCVAISCVQRAMTTNCRKEKNNYSWQVLSAPRTTQQTRISRDITISGKGRGCFVLEEARTQNNTTPSSLILTKIQWKTQNLLAVDHQAAVSIGYGDKAHALQRQWSIKVDNIEDHPSVVLLSINLHYFDRL